MSKICLLLNRVIKIKLIQVFPITTYCDVSKTTMVSDHAPLIYASVHMKFIVSTYTTQGYITQWCVELPPIIEVALAMIFHHLKHINCSIIPYI